jgi:Helix-turn-helix domain of resolvase
MLLIIRRHQFPVSGDVVIECGRSSQLQIDIGKHSRHRSTAFGRADCRLFRCGIGYTSAGRGRNAQRERVASPDPSIDRCAHGGSGRISLASRRRPHRGGDGNHEAIDLLIKARTDDGRRRTLARGKCFGRKPKLSAFQIEEELRRRDAGEALTEIARSYGVSHSTISRLPYNAGAVAAEFPSRF